MKYKRLIVILVVSVLVWGSACKKTETKPSEPEPEPNYTNFKILNVKLTAMPFVDANATSWDSFSGPDVFFNMEDANGNILRNGNSARFNDISTNSLPLSWDLTNAHQITNIQVTQLVAIYDYDSPDPDDFIGKVGFTLNDHKEGYSKTISKSSGSLSITITGEWF